MHVYITPQCKRLAEQRGIWSAVCRLQDEINSQGIEVVQARFERVYPYLKRKEGNLRLIARIRRVGNEQVLCLLAIFRRGDSDYEYFLRDRENFGSQYLDSQVPDVELKRWFNERQASRSRGQHSPKLLDPNLLPWLDRPSWEMDASQAIVYETEEWVTRFKNPQIRAGAEIYCRLIDTIVVAEIDICEPGGAGMGALPLQLYGEGNRYVLFSRIATVDPERRQVLFLLAPFADRPSAADIEQIVRAIDPSNASINYTSLAKRAYPSYLLGYPELWLAIEDEEAANLALSAEEEAILHSVSTSDSNHKSLPLFLNGGAGSGKSTMLFHLFADYCYRKFYNKQGHKRHTPLAGNPLFLTYNERLLEVAKERVPRLLSAHHQFLAHRGEVGDDIPNIVDFFQPFRTFLRNLLPREERDRFSDENYISFHRFRQFCRKAWPHHSPERCWLVIRTFIKGYYLDDRDTYMDAEDYKEVPGKERTVTPAEFEKIYNTVWKWYGKLAEKGYWDDQDLIRTVLKHKYYRSEYTAIFCDEAQDFTRLELQLIVRLSVFSQYDLEKQLQSVKSLPFAFAGDPLQTLNPSGFRWASLQAAFYNEVIMAVSPTGRSGLEMNFKELEWNYRSCPSIVKVNNLIQLWRRTLFNISELKPQTAWKRGEFEPQKFILGQNISALELGFYIRQTIIIVPCDEGGEVDYVKDDEVLRQLLSKETSSKPPWNVLSAIAAKGLEFKKIILYKFGEACNRAVWNTASDPPEEVKYFFNKLYVAASRATERLFVVDSETGEQRLWRYASNAAEIETLLQRSGSAAQWQGRIHTLSLGDIPDVLHDEDLESIAQEFEIQGLNLENPDFIRRARGAYSQIGNTAKALFCEARALEFEGKFLDAGRCFLQLGLSDEAWQCFWQGMCWAELLTLVDRHDRSKTTELPIAVFMVGVENTPSLDAIRNFTQFLKDCIQNNQLENNYSSKQWKTALEEYAKRIVGLMGGANLEREEWQQFGNVLKTLGLLGDNEMLNRAGACFYRARNYESAVRCWEECGAIRKRDYYLAKAEAIDFPECLEYLEKAGESDRIIALWETADKPVATQGLKYVGSALETKQKYHLAFQVYMRFDNVVKVKECFERLSKENKVELIESLLQYLIRKNHWGEFVETLEKYLPLVSGSESNKGNLRFDVVCEIANSKLKPEDIVPYYQRYEKFIKEQVLSSAEWHNYLLMEQVGVALEKIGSLVETLRFYEGFVSDSVETRSKTSLQFARSRWLATKRKQVDYFTTQNQLDKAAKSQSELQRNATNWNISLEFVLLEPPTVPKHRSSPSLDKPALADTFTLQEGVSVEAPEELALAETQVTSQPHLPSLEVADTLSETQITSQPYPHSATQETQIDLEKNPLPADSAIEGLPLEIKVEQLEYGVERFQIRHLVVKVMRDAKLVSIADVLNSTEFRVDLAQSRVNIGDVTVESSGRDRLSFAMPKSSYSGVVVYGGAKPRLELNILSVSGQIYIEL